MNNLFFECNVQNVQVSYIFCAYCFMLSQGNEDAAAPLCPEKGVGGSPQLHMWTEGGLPPSLPGAESCYVSASKLIRVTNQLQTCLPWFYTFVGWVYCVTTAPWRSSSTASSPTHSSYMLSWLSSRPASSRISSNTPSRATAASVSDCSFPPVIVVNVKLMSCCCVLFLRSLGEDAAGMARKWTEGWWVYTGRKSVSVMATYYITVF